jgi:hypothetical protein
MINSIEDFANDDRQRGESSSSVDGTWWRDTVWRLEEASLSCDTKGKRTGESRRWSTQKESTSSELE